MKNDTQKEILSNYQKHYPNQTLREMAEHTGIHYTRIFRLLNGYEMKLKEYIIIKSLLKNDSNYSQFMEQTKRCLNQLKPEKLRQIGEYMEMKLFYHTKEIV